MPISITKKLRNLPNSPGVYLFYGKSKNILYVGKATSLKDRVGSYFVSYDTNTRMNANDANMRNRCESTNELKSTNLRMGLRPIETMISEVEEVKIKKTETVLEAYILEQELIKKLQPKYNVDGKDDKSFCFVVVTKEEFPRLMLLRKTDLEKIKNQSRVLGTKFKNIVKNSKLSNRILNTKYQIRDTNLFGPYTSRKQIEIALKILRKIFPYHSKTEKTEKGCLDYQIGLCPGPYDGAISKIDYAKNIRAIKMILLGKKKNLIAKLKKEMEVYSKSQEFEKAADARNKLFALQHIRDIALISENPPHLNPLPAYRTGRLIKERGQIRIEGYDISNISGKSSVGSMVVFDNSGGEMLPNKNEYRKFKIKTIKEANDVGMMREVLLRRFQNNWPKPNLILLDGGAGHLNVARQVLRNYKLEIPILAVAKGPKRKKLDLRSFGSVPKIPLEIIEQIRDEAHRFAITYHKKLRKKSFME